MPDLSRMQQVYSPCWRLTMRANLAQVQATECNELTDCMTECGEVSWLKSNRVVDFACKLVNHETTGSGAATLLHELAQNSCLWYQ